ncbi:MAG TPA: hypothetical protein VIK18_06195 [Pirellulales bacterium]
MHETLQEFVDSRGVTMRVDRQAGVIRGVKILGLQSRNGRSYLPAALAGAVALYEGAKVNVNHPKGAPEGPRDYQDRIGVVRNVTLRAEEGLFADLHFNPAHALAGQLAWDAEHQPENVGFSHNVQARVTRDAQRVLVEAITKVQSVDLVADPATTRGLFESQTAGGSPIAASDGADRASELSLEQLRRARPDLLEQVEQPLREQLARVNGELDALRAQSIGSQKRDLALRLLAEQSLPLPDGQDPWSRAVVSEAFFEALLSATDETQMRRLVEERARLVQSVRQWPAGGPARPVSRGQLPADRLLAEAPDARTFARLIS